MSVAERVTSRKRGSQRISRPSETTDIESDLITFPHVPIHTNISQTEDNDLDENNKEMERVLGLKGDKLNVAVLIFLYVLQGIPLGLAGSIPMVLSSRNVSYKEQALFSFVYWPFSVKLLWAPIVDAAYFPKFGRRKTWLVPIQYLIALFMWTLSNHVTDLLGNAGDETFQVDVRTLTVVFFMLNFLAATQDIAVDGWALTMLERRNVGWASTCNSVGQTAGFFLGNVVFLALESADFCNTYLRSEPQPEGLVTLGSFLKFWSYVFLISTTLVAIFKHENSSDEEDNEGIIDTYKLLGKILKKPAIISLIGILLTCKIGFAATDGASGLKLIEAGVPREKLALLAIPMVPIQIILPLIISRFTAGPKPLDVFVKAMPYRLCMGIVFALLVYWTSIVKQSYGEHPFWYYIVLLIGYALHQVAIGL
ncbi:unnamed protein product [Owenia fusiformis]|uniref:Acetyl-coenzyme A transporter 1 n=1 Tax=Owenia fusiformis TaxID=6347 RepID=A0A8S4N5Q6_OWEFU|nr:unnamed protein product [Owenia fusiformis]